MAELIGNNRILGEIGSGGMATIYRAVQEPLGRMVAIKALKASIAIDSQFAERFQREARFMASLQHENIIHVHDFVVEGDSMYIVMEYVRGIDLYDLLEKTPQLVPEVAAIVALQVARALDYAHFRGIIHRDIKPANVMISHQGEVKLMDFGIARDDTLSDLTETGTGLGTPSYMSPEQILGDKLDFRSDIFSLGIVLYQMLTGQKPFVEDDARTVMQKIRLDRYMSPRRLRPGVPRPLERILARCMEKMPANRYPTTQALIDDLVEFIATRVTTNYNARLVMYLRDVGVITDNEAEDILHAGGPRTVRRTLTDRNLLRHTTMVQGTILLAAVLSGGAIQAMSGRFDGGRKGAEPETETFSPEEAARLKVVVDPWADVFVDGKKMGTTPMAQPLLLSPGVHYVRFINPYHKTVDRELRLRTGEIQTVSVELEPLRQRGEP
ncbi:MAG: serine/threonine protein kinase [Myxococcales bacterium]|nr:serine/threonine protein kinase [Myxococcales bacterium]